MLLDYTESEYKIIVTDGSSPTHPYWFAQMFTAYKSQSCCSEIKIPYTVVDKLGPGSCPEIVKLLLVKTLKEQVR